VKGWYLNILGEIKPGDKEMFIRRDVWHGGSDEIRIFEMVALSAAIQVHVFQMVLCRRERRRHF
jgi:hypothetical protein